MTGGDIFKVIIENKDYIDAYNSDDTFKNTIDSIMEKADEGSDKIANIIVNMAYSFQIIYSSIISTIIECKDPKTIDAVNKLIIQLMTPQNEE